MLCVVSLCFDLCTITFDADPNLCAEIVCNDLYTVYGQNVSNNFGNIHMAFTQWSHDLII